MGNYVQRKGTATLILLVLCGCWRQGHKRLCPPPQERTWVHMPESPHDPDDVAPVPEPCTLVLLGGGLAALAAARRRKKNNATDSLS